ncbi:ankyrin repeat-containing domain protein [Xylaria bambusicola]|uniref:ankyrin repeat-containing domain protein n=1 Tax=Xylaria bambusicola TaxID=326684 RepID=UPI002008D1C4|nr:ankyrin repeat-containing domain protein [Xylaria bambusicola]KAI0527850.1 ankyrin repeat-containing domain protein [Xylaria bambusicola]
MASNTWEQHKMKIVLMYCVEKQPLSHIISYMKEHHNFDKKSCQYEYRLRTWGIKKNATKQVWNYVAHCIQKRNRKSRCSKVILYGVPVPEERLRKEVQRYTNIPRAAEFGQRVPSPQTPDSNVVCVRSPSVIELGSIWPETLPWLQFEQKLRTILYQPSGLLDSLWTTFGSVTLEPQYQKNEDLWSLFPMSGDISMLRRAISHYSKMIPSNCPEMNQLKALVPANESDSIAIDMLRVIFFQLSNNFWDTGNFQQRDQFVLRIVEALSRSSPQMVSALLADNSRTANAIKESIYKSAIREKSYAIVSRLLASGIDPRLPMTLSDEFRISLSRVLQRGKIKLHLEGYWNQPSLCTGIQFAAFITDTRLGKILLDAGANANTSSPEDLPPLELIGLHSNTKADFDDALEFAHMLVKYGAKVNLPRQLSWCGSVISSSSLDLALGRYDKPLADFLIEQGANKTMYTFLDFQGRQGGWFSRQLQPRGFRYSPLLVAIVSGIDEITEQLLQPILSDPDQAPLNFIQDIFITSCLAGDSAIVAKLLSRTNIDLDKDWVRGITPLVATAWNPDVTIAKMLLRARADVGPKVNESATRTSIPCPLHVAAFHGNAELVRILIGHGASCNVQLDYRDDSEVNYYYWDDSEPRLLPMGLSYPLHLALMSEDSETITLILPHSELIGGEIAQAVNFGDKTIISKLISKGADIHSISQDGTAALESAAANGNTEIVSLFFALGGNYRSSALYKAVAFAIESGDHFLVSDLMGYRPAGPIDSYEASCLVLALQESEWDLVHQLLDSLAPGPSQSFYLLKRNVKNGLELNTIPASHEFPDHSGTGITPLWAAYLFGNVSIVEEMLQKGYTLQKGDQKSFGWTALYHDDERSNSVLLFLLSTSQFECLNQEGRQMLLLGSIKLCDQHKTRAHEYIKLIDSLNFTNGDDGDHSPLTLTVEMNRSDLISELINAGADVNYVETKNPARIKRSALQRAVEFGYIDIVKLLIEKGAHINQPLLSNFQNTALQAAAGYGCLESLKVLIDKGADINALPAKRYGRTALESAAENGRLDVVQLLLDNGASLRREMRIYYVRSEYGSWTLEDQILYDRPSTLEVEGYFHYDEQSNDWNFQRVKWDDDSGWYSVASTSTTSSAEDGTYNNSSEMRGSDHRELAIWREPERDMEDWFRTLVDTFDESAGFGACWEEETNNHLTLPFRTNSFQGKDNPLQLSDEDAETAMVELAESCWEQQSASRPDNVESQLTTGEQQRRAENARACRRASSHDGHGAYAME